jgi:L-malate glycosyltransferase
MENRIKLLKILSNFFIGGTERQFVYVANGLDRARFAVEIGCLRREGPLLDSLERDMAVHTYPVHRSCYSFRSILSQFRLLRDVSKNRFDIVHTYGWYPNVFAVPPSRMALRPAVIASIRDAGAYMTTAKVQALKLACALSDCVLANSHAGRDWLLAQGVNGKKIEVIHNGIVVPPQAERILESGPVRREFGIPPDVPVCACIGRVVSGKGIDDYLKAARILQDRGRDVRFLMIGVRSSEQDYQSEVDKLTRELNLEQTVIFTGQRHDVAAMLREVNVVVHPSLTEGLSNVILEAMAAAIPVVATRVGGNAELVDDGQTGYLVNARSPEEIANAICRLLDQPQMAQVFGARARQRVIAEFSISRMLSKTEDLYARVLEQRLAFAPRNRIDFRKHESNSFLH